MKQWLQDRRDRSGTRPTHALVGSIIGDLDGPTAVVDEHGRVGAADGSWWLEWGVGAEDRWRVAHDEVAVRQARVADAPVYETWMRVPGGDVIQRVASANDGLGRVLTVEFENASSAAVAVALSGRGAGRSSIGVDADSVTLDGVEWIRGERPAGGTVVVDGDPWPAVTAGPDAARIELGPAERPAGALILGLPHRQTVTFVVLLEGEFPSRPVGPDEISAGWRAVTAEALTIEVPDDDLGEAWSRILPDLIVQAGSTDPRLAAEAAPMLDIAGLSGEADRARATVVSAAEDGALGGSDAVAALRALASRDLRAATPSGLDALAGPLAGMAGESLDVTTLDQVARALDGGFPGAALDARRAATAATGSFVVKSAPAVAADRVLAMVIEVDADGSIDLLPRVPETWHGQPIDVRSCATVSGRVSFSVRWHGDRPALLWERRGGPDEVELRCRGLDPSWRSSEREGEALLGSPS
jgi:hypothetical protein